MTGKNWSELLQPIQAAGVAEAIVRRLGELLGSGILLPGDRLPTESELAGYFGVSPMTVRSALQVMRNYELVETRRGRGAGTFVREGASTKLHYADEQSPTLEAFTDFTVWREAVSGEACAIAAAASTPEIVAELRELAALADAPGLGPEEYRFADARLHLRVAELTGSQRLLEAEQQIQDFLTRSLANTGQAPDSTKLKAQGHKPLIDAISAGAPDVARARFREHARATVDVLVGLGYLSAEEPEAARA
ncbi:FadR/GntR family transcriptional regulator [Leucobacter sp. M11]|uniref:FadR/GntR family transcriptional regulator n=1 Tax=Leucobacter sp. M11 TaxID=2993565 RepID=UPI002D8023E1|nr:FCD domain-containing protein [Leucobacter sp. M11]MEB4613795.1 FCD domain-containing protein [Leucobacter sp. M11]